MAIRSGMPAGVSILVAEGDPEQARLLARIIGAHGYRALTAPDGQQALAAARHHRPTLILSDVALRHLDGYELCQAVKADPVLRNIPVVLVTGLTDPREVIRALECGVDNFIRKPYDENHLLTLIDYLLANTRSRDNYRQQMGVEINLHGTRHLITAARQQLLDMLLSTYEQAVDLSQEVKAREAEIARAHELLNALYRFARDVNGASTEREILDIATARALEIPGVYAAWVLLQEDGHYVLAASRRVAAAIAAEPIGACACLRIATTPTPVATNIDHCVWFDRGAVRRRGHASIPLWLSAGSLGVLNLATAHGGGFSEENLQILHGVGNQIAIAIQRARLLAAQEKLVAERTAALSAQIEERKRIEAAQARMVAILEATTDFVGISDLSSQPLYLNANGRRMVGIALDQDIESVSIEDYIAPRDRDRHRTEALATALRDGIWSGEIMLRARDGREVPVSQVIIAHRDQVGRARYLSTIARDISQHRQQETRTLRLNRVYALLSGVSAAIVRIGDRQELFSEVCRIGVEVGNYRSSFIALFEPEGGAMLAAVAGASERFIQHFQTSIRDEYANHWNSIDRSLRDGVPVVINDIAASDLPALWRTASIERGCRSVVAFPIVEEGQTIGALGLYGHEPDVFDPEEINLLTQIGGDLTFALDHLKKEARLSYLAYYDALTGLPNRTLFYDRLQRALAPSTAGTLVAVVVLDLERFRFINETFGRATGDRLLTWVGERLLRAAPDPGLLTHLSADTFALAFTCTDADEVALLVERQILAGFRESFAIADEALHIAVRSGIALFPADGTDADTLVRNAEAALKKTKLSGERSLFYAVEFNATVAETLALENKLRRALQRRELALFYQPKINLANGRISGLEALMRWHDPDVGMVPPNRFIPILEETGMIIEAGRWALEQAAADARDWCAAGFPALRIAVNVSPIQLRQRGFDSLVGEVLGDAGITTAEDNLLDLEITESVMMADMEENIRKLQELRTRGIEVAVDDFGTGYSSLSHIRKLPITTLKIDRSFIANIATRPDDLNLVSTIIILARTMNLKTVAEGVETREQAILLRRLKCDQIQGFLFSPAVPAARIGQMLRTGQMLSLSS